ncbi:MAG TPA: hypothetical protein VG937_01515 [Polyangiaceae bacterium]|nr:hypothetical protein [Polyangiaceae bacterium]
MTPRPLHPRAQLLAVALTLASASLQAAPAASPSAAPAASAVPTPSTAPAPVPSTAPAPTRFPLWLDLGHSGLDKTKVRAAIEQELGAPVELTETADTPLRVIIDSNQRVQIAFTTPSGESLSRTVDLPADPERRVEIIALMVGNLTRNEAADLLSALEAARRSAAEKPAPAPPAEPEPEPKPQTKPAPPPAANALLPTPAPGINVSLFHPVSLYRDSDRRLLKLELGFAYSHVGGIQGAALSLGGLRVEQHVRGLAFGSIFSIVGGPVHGFHYSHFYAEGRGPTHGIALSGLVLRHQAPLTGAAIAGLVDIGDDVEGLRLSGLFNLSKRVKGAAIAGLASIARDPVDGLQIAGLFSAHETLDGIGIAGLGQVGGDAEGLQIAGLANVSAKTRGFTLGGLSNVTNDLDGFALSGLANVNRDVDGLALSVVNVGRQVNGAQIGVVNVAKEIHGAQLGLINVAENGRIQPEAFATNFTPLNVGVRFVGGYAYSELALGWDPASKENEYSAGIGGHFEVASLTVETGVHGSTTQEPQTSETPTRIDLHYRARVGYRIASFIEPFIGGGVRHGMWGEGEREFDPEFQAGIAFF